MAPVSEIQLRSRRAQVLDILREAILEGDYGPGEALIETELAARLGVSRAPLREALQVLSAEGLVDMVPYHGTTVRVLTARDIEELYSLRGVLEAFAIQRVIERGAEQALRQLRESYEEMRIAAEAGDARRVNGEDLRFHTTLIALSDHGMLQSMWNLVAIRVRHVMALRNKLNRNLSQIAANHVPILDAILNRDTALGVQLIQKHVASAGDLVLGDWPATLAETDSGSTAAAANHDGSAQ